jgi:hypothetical protein
MKKIVGLTLSAVLALPGLALAQSSNQKNAPTGSQTAGTSGGYSSPTSQTGNTAQNSAGSETVKGTISQDGKTLVGDDGKSWTIANPDAVKGHEGHHVALKGSADASSNQIQVSSVKMMKEKGSKKDTTQPQ